MSIIEAHSTNLKGITDEQIMEPSKWPAIIILMPMCWTSPATRLPISKGPHGHSGLNARRLPTQFIPAFAAVEFGGVQINRNQTRHALTVIDFGDVRVVLDWQ